MRKIIRYVFISLMLACGLILALPLAGLRKNLDAELSKPIISQLSQNGNNYNKKNIQLFNVLGLALNNPSDQMVLIAENNNNSNPDKNPDKLIYISYVVKADKSSGTAGSSNTTDFSGQNNQPGNPGYSPLIAAGKTVKSDNATQQATSGKQTTETNTVSKRQAIDTPDPGGSGGGTPLGSLPIGDANYLVAFLLGLMTLYKFKKTSLI